ncbi:hypothetical protein N7516_004537 [Penicillium verrucosum]|uniref:uncharacterized protein n=1 Tax=Penicillium verrucosum TaxID=60171 RepID=UPI002545A779|nr:uncharacterized protein N7516_004537 [Penicillium verrucosum]KAJ5944369.1 hypothetical protein N7516_004537 [Penicillium verrucosum]
MNMKMTISWTEKPLASVEEHTRATIKTLFQFLHAQARCAYLATQSPKHGNDPEVILAALLHDVGRFIPAAEKMDKMITPDGKYIGRQSHEALGESYLRHIGFSEKLLFGVLSDVWGRHIIYGKELLLTLFGTLMVVLLPWNRMSAQSVTAWISIFRVVTRVGIGAAEKSPFGSRAIQVLTVFSNIGLGNITASIVFLILLKAFEGSIADNLSHLEWVWRLLLGIGIVPALFTLYARLTIKETQPYKQYVCDDTAGQNRTFKKQWEDFCEYFSHCNIAYYGVNLNQSIILARIGYAHGETPWRTLYNTAVGNVIIQVAGYLPGFYVGIFLPDRIGRFLLTVGPNCTTFLIPTEVFPTRVRGTAHGISAAAGKYGAIITAFAFGSVEDAIGLEGVLGLFSGIMLLTALVTLLIPETKNQTLEGIETDELYRKHEAVAELPYSNVKVGNKGLYVAKTSFDDN